MSYKEMDSDKYEIKSKRKILWKEFYSEVSLGGFKYLFSERGLIKLLWIVGFVGALVFAVYLNFSCIKDFATFKSYSRFQQEVLEEIDFPSVTICNINSLLNYKVKGLGIEKAVEEFRTYYEYFNPSLRNASYKLIQNIAADLLRRNITTMEELVNKTDINMFDMLGKFSKTISRRPCSYYGKECFPNDFKFTSTWLVFLSTCHQFNPYVKGKESLKVKRGGIEKNFNFVGNLHIDDLFYTPYNLAGLLVMVHPYGIPSFKTDSTYTYFATPGRMNVLQLKLKKMELLPPPYSSKCGKVDLKIIKGYPYSKAACETDCVLQKVYEICGCVGYTLKEYVDNIPICNVTAQVCYMRESRRLDKTLKCNCPRSCTIYAYDVVTTQMALGSETAIEKFGKIPGWNATRVETEDYIEKNMIGVWVYFRHLVVRKEIITPTVKWSNLLGNVGGNIGLCIGFSVITIYEFLFFFWSYASVGRSNQYDYLRKDKVRRPSYTCSL